MDTSHESRMQLQPSFHAQMLRSPRQSSPLAATASLSSPSDGIELVSSPSRPPATATPTPTARPGSGSGSSSDPCGRGDIEKGVRDTRDAKKDKKDKDRASPPLRAELSDGTLAETTAFLLALCHALHRFGLPTHRLEYEINRQGGADCHTYTIANEASWDLGKLEAAEQLAKRVASGKISLSQGIQDLKLIQATPPKYPWWGRVACLTVMSGVLCPLFYRGGVVESCAALLCGLVSGLLVLMSDKTVQFSRLYEPFVAIASAVIAVVVYRVGWFGPVCQGSIMLAGILWGLPGLHVNAAIGDLATHMMVSGTSRMLFSLLIVFELSFGLALGSRVSGLFPHDEAAPPLTTTPSMPITKWLDIIWTPLGAISYAIMINTEIRQLPCIILCSAFACTVTLMAPVFGPDLSTMLAQAAVILTGNIYERAFDRPGFIPSCIGSLMLMPASLGVRNATASLTTQNYLSGMEFTFTLLVTEVSMVVGGFLANMILLPKRPF
eukprot:m51a1_g5792 hypothetical protein (496) ;mRNA; f:37495-39273